MNEFLQDTIHVPLSPGRHLLRRKPMAERTPRAARTVGWVSSDHEGSDGPAAGQSVGAPPVDPAPGVAAGFEPDRVPPQDELQAMEQRVRRTRVSATWVGIIISTVVLVLLLIFILENLRDVKVTYFGATGQLPLGVALIFAAIGGALLVAMVGVARLNQLRLNARQRRRASANPRSVADD